MEKFAVAVSCNPLMNRLGKPRYNLMMNNINASHMLSFHFPEIMSDAASHPRMCIVIFNNMSDIFYTMYLTPASNLTAEAGMYQMGHCIHIFCTNLCGFFFRIVPQCRKIGEKFLFPGLC